MLTVRIALLLAQASATLATNPVSTNALPVPSAAVVGAPGAPATAVGTEADDADAEMDAPEEASAEMEELRAVEEETLSRGPKASPDVLGAIRRLGVANPLRERMVDAYQDSPTHEQNAPPELPLITDLARFDVGVVKDEYDIPVEMQPLVAQYIQFFQGPGRKWFRNWMSRSTRFIPLMQPILESKGVPKDTVYLAMIESGFSTNAYSWAHAVGPWQFISGTAKVMGLKVDFWIDERKDPIKSTQAAAKYLNLLHSQLGHWYLAWAAYNTGGSRVRRVIRRKGSSDFWVLSDGRGLAKETKHYVPKLIACALVAKHPKAFGFSEDEFSFLGPLEYEEVQIPSPTDLGVIAQAVGAPLDELRDLNPELRRWYTPPASEETPYLLRIPKGTGAKFAENFPKVAPRERLGLIVHKVHRGETLSTIAAHYHTAAQAILQFNRLESNRRLRPNTELAIPVPSEATSQLASAQEAAERTPVKARHKRFASRGSTPGPNRTSYAVRPGDTLWSLSQRFGCSVEDLVRWNALSARGALRSGSKLVIYSGTGGSTSGSPEESPLRQGRGGSANTHTLAAGETLWSVARRYGLTVEDLKRWNRIGDQKYVRAGQALTVVQP